MMTTGINDIGVDLNCIDDTCLFFLDTPNSRWAYHNAPYLLLRDVVESATGQGINMYINQKLNTQIGMFGFFGVNNTNLFYSNTRSMARFGLLVLNQGKWNGSSILNDSIYFNQMINTSQPLNESYGYLWWLNGKNSHMQPRIQFTFNGSLNSNAPTDMISALGKNGQIINITDTNLSRGVANYSIYSAAKAGLEAITKGLARELAPEIKVNAIAPGAMLEPPDVTWTEEQKNKVISSIPLKRMGSEKDIAEAVKFLESSDYITGQIIKVDGGRSL